MNLKISVKTRKRGVIMLTLFLVISLIILIALFKLQIIDFTQYQSSVIDQMTVETSVNPLRGSILDRNNNVLASNKTVWSLYVSPKKITSVEKIADLLSDVVNVDHSVIAEKASKRGYKLQLIKKSLDKNTADKIRDIIKREELYDQITLVAEAKRYYPYSSLCSHSIGFVNADGVGIYGLEKVYNNILEGTSGKYITAQNAQSGDMPFQYETYIEDTNGYNLVSTIDVYIQQQLEAQLKTASLESGAQNRAAGIVMNPKNGEIYAIAVYPGFDLNQPYILDELSMEKLNGIEKDTKKYNNEYMNLVYSMWNNKAVTELYEPGSTFKLVTTSVALMENAATLSSRFNCSGSLKIDGYYRAISCHKRTGHGSLTFAEALQQSCNPSMMRLAFGIGREKFYEYFNKFGYTEKTGIDLPYEAKGYYHKYEDFSNVSLAVYSFGQTFKTTAIQQLRAVSAVANGGYLVTPHLLKEITDNDGNVIYQNKVGIGEQIISSDVSQTISKILKDGVDGEGGAKNAYVAGYSIAAKTGTSEKKDKFDENGNTSYRVSSCIAYAPSEDAQVAVIILVDEPSIGSKYGSVVAAPYVSNLLELILPYLGCEPTYNEKDNNYLSVRVPDLTEKATEEAVSLLKKLKINYEVIGEGDRVLKTMPAPNSLIYLKNGKVIIYTGQEEIRTCQVPNVVGKSVEEANTILINNGFNIRFSTGNGFKIGQGAIVTAQSYAPGESCLRGTVITITVAYTEDKD